MKYLLLFLSLLGVNTVFANDKWPQAAGPDANWKIDGEAPTKWSAFRNENVLWRTPMPEAGQSSVTVWQDKAFVTTHTPIKTLEEKEGVKDVIGFCLDAHTGKILWQVTLPGSAFISLAGGFTDGTVFAPICDGKNVWFFNRCGSMGCYDMEGNKVWLREFTPRFKHNNRQFEPVIVNNAILYVEVHDKANGGLMKKWDAPGKKSKNGTNIPQGVNPKDVWTYVHGIDKMTGKVLWREDTGTSVHATPMIAKMADGNYGIVHARGGGHGPIEKPYGLSLSSLKPGEEGKNIWSKEFKGFSPSFNSHWNEKYVYALSGGKHYLLDSTSGNILKEASVEQGDVCRFDPQKNEWIKESNVKIKNKRTNTNHANIVSGKYHYFLAHDVHYCGRVNTETGKVEFLELPAQLMPGKESSSQDKLLWKNPNKGNTPLNANGFAVGNKGHNGSGWGHISAASPTIVGKHLIWPVVTGTVYVLDISKENWDQNAIVAVNDLGEGGKTWSLSSVSFAHGRLYMHTMTEIICIGK